MAQFSFVTLLFYSYLFPFLTRTCISTLDSINPSKSLRDGETLVSVGQTFELGFFSLSNPKLRYLGIWYKQITPRTIVWVANKETPLSNTLGALNISSQGNLFLVNGTNQTFWSSNTSTIAKDPVAQLFDSGNFVVTDANDSNNQEKFLWQSFDYPVDTHLAGMKLGINLVTGHETFLSSWKSIEDPAPGLFYTHLDLQGYPQFLLKRENKTLYRIGSWNGQRLTGAPVRSHLPFITSEYVSNDKEMYVKYDVHNSSIFVRSTVTPSGIAQSFLWSAEANDWVVLSTTLTDECGNYAFCGAYASCEINNSPVCSCLDGFIPKSPKDWDMQVWSDGCVQRTPLNCSNNDGFRKHSGIKLPDTSSSWYDRNIDLKECENLCLSNCTCTAYANLDTREGGSGCLLWFNNLIDIRGLAAGGQDLYVKMAASELAKMEKKRSSRKEKAIIITGTLVVVISMLMTFYMCRRKLRKHGMTKESHIGDYKNREGTEDMELLMFDLTTIVNATCNFSNNNKLGQGGFGPVYKGTLADGQEIAVKRLSKSSGQGMTEFKNEVILISKLQHRNLVKLLGCCIQKDEKMLIYEFMTNKSLDFFIFDQTKRKLLDWHKRFHIIDGIARGLLYLHQDSRLRIIHRDLKTSNVLLDKDTNPKISDFGMARTFAGDQTEANTNKVAGTFGYMSPEYAVDGLFSMKSDVFSFGVLILEIISGKKNRGFSRPDHDHNLLGHAWKLWIEERSLELVDNMLDYFTISEVLRCIHVGLLCVQKRPEDRPNMSLVVTMLCSESSLPKPKQPGFFIERNVPKAECSSSKHGSSSINEMSTTLIEGR